MWCLNKCVVIFGDTTLVQELEWSHYSRSDDSDGVHVTGRALSGPI